MTQQALFNVSRMPTGAAQFLTLPLPPSVNTYWRKSPHGMYITQQGKDFRQNVAEIVAERRAMKFGKARLFMAVRLCMRDRRPSDDGQAVSTRDSVKLKSP